MGPITEDDIINSLDIIKDSLYMFNRTYLNKDYIYIKNSFNRFMNNINNSYLVKLKRSLNMISLKFSTILTESSYKNLEDIIFNQYYDIELYINNLSNLIDLSEMDLLGKINNSSLLLASIYNRIYKKIIVFYKALNEVIQKKLKNINKEEYNSFRKLDNSNIDLNDIQESNKGIIKRWKSLGDDNDYEYDWDNDDDDIDEDYNDDVNYEYEDDDEDDGDDDNNDDDDSITLYEKVKSLKVSPKFDFNIPIIPTLDFQISINPSFYFEIGVSLTIEKEDDYSLNIDAWGEVEVRIRLDAALSFPSVESHLKKVLPVPVITVGIGMDGQLISIKVGLKLSLILNKSQFEIDLYSEIKAFSFSFYCLFRFEFSIPFLGIDFEFEFYLFKYKFDGISLEVHAKKAYNCLK